MMLISKNTSDLHSPKKKKKYIYIYIICIIFIVLVTIVDGTMSWELIS